MSEDGVKKYYGKFRGMVMNNVDPMQRGRLLVEVADISSLFPSTWALPCVPFTGKQMGFFVLPPLGSGVWVEFEQGDPNYPIWTGSWWDVGEVPVLAMAGTPVSPNIVMQTQLQTHIVVSDNPALGIQLALANGAGIYITPAGLLINNGAGAVIAMVGNTVTVNGGALTVI